jgi:hypothetical protein
MQTDVEIAFGTLTALIAKRKRALREYEARKDYRWHGERYLREARMTEVDIHFAFYIPSL